MYKYAYMLQILLKKDEQEHPYNTQHKSEFVFFPHKKKHWKTQYRTCPRATSQKLWFFFPPVGRVDGTEDWLKGLYIHG